MGQERSRDRCSRPRRSPAQERRRASRGGEGNYSKGRDVGERYEEKFNMFSFVMPI